METQCEPGPLFVRRGMLSSQGCCKDEILSLLHSKFTDTESSRHRVWHRDSQTTQDGRHPRGFQEGGHPKRTHFTEGCMWGHSQQSLDTWTCWSGPPGWDCFLPGLLLLGKMVQKHQPRSSAVTSAVVTGTADPQRRTGEGHAKPARGGCGEPKIPDAGGWTWCRVGSEADEPSSVARLCEVDWTRGLTSGGGHKAEERTGSLSSVRMGKQTHTKSTLCSDARQLPGKLKRCFPEAGLGGARKQQLALALQTLLI